MKLLFLLPTVFLSVNVLGGGNDPLRTAEDLRHAVYDQPDPGAEFDLTVRALSPKPSRFSRLPCDDVSGAALLVFETPTMKKLDIRAGDRLHVTGTIDIGKRSKNPYARCDTAEILGHETAPAPIDVSVRDLQNGKHAFRTTRIRGLVRDVFRDEIDPGYSYLVLVSDETVFYAPFETSQASYADLDRLVGADVTVVGNCYPFGLAARKKIGRMFHPAGGLDAVHVLRTAAAAVADAPDISTLSLISPQRIALLGLHRAKGRVIARWDRTNLLVKSPEGTVTGITLAAPTAPAYGDTIEVFGFPESDLYRINLSRAIWKPLSPPLSCDETPRDTTVRDFMTDEYGRRCFNPYAHGAALRFSGTVVSLPGIGNDDGRLLLRSGDYLVPIDFSTCACALHGLEVGCSIRIAGTCVMESDNWRASSAFPRIRGFALVVRTPDDVRILSRPAWWTPRRLLAVIGSLSFLLIGILIWNLVLRRLIERRGRQLFKAQIAQTSAALKVEERTRLAVELHDALSQNLTGASMQIDAARKLLPTSPEKTARHLDMASSTLEASREELRNCIWDLRNQSLETPDMNEAIRRTLERHLGDARLSVRFNIPRARFSDNTAHALLCIIRELATNAVRHGLATEIRIAGARENGQLLFSVRDNGCGFDPKTAVGRTQGHFGLQGIRERLKQMNGTLVLDSGPNRGTKATVTIFLSPHKGSSAS